MSAIVVFTQTPLLTSARNSFGAPSNVANPGCVARNQGTQPNNLQTECLSYYQTCIYIYAVTKLLKQFSLTAIWHKSANMQTFLTL